MLESVVSLDLNIKTDGKSKAPSAKGDIDLDAKMKLPKVKGD
jgi:hypothetical protein